MWSGWRTGTVAADAAVVLLGLGTNLGDRAANLRAAVTSLATLGTVERLSRIYESEPYGFTGQSRFLNMALRMRTALAPDALLRAAKDLERRLGRTATHRMGPRVIDIDILLWGAETIERPGFTVPHPGIMEREFVLAPLLDLDPDLRHPVTRERLADRLAALPDRSLVVLGSAADVLDLANGTAT
ncbi:MAG TPA: 2-amino-4-hydroxy-6-hydroxymethyldihydropteridine diphosphokinase [Longimicrobiales bacterium]